jgi:hypothetical protein
MGLLDDAIREHLDLKRRRGADPSEVARLEQEALGPVRREPAPAEPADEHHEAHDAHEPAAAQPASEGLPPEDATRVLAPEDRHEPPHGDPLLEQHAHNVELGGAAAKAPEPTAAPEPVEKPEPAREPEPDPEPRASTEDPRRTDVVDQPTTEYRIEDHHDEDEHEGAAAAAHGGPDEDVLEETPDFLQETPEHDRLWFEQRPPRDFDFDG